MIFRIANNNSYTGAAAVVDLGARELLLIWLMKVRCSRYYSGVLTKGGSYRHRSEILIAFKV